MSRRPEDAGNHCEMTVGGNLVLSSVSRQAGRVPGLIDFRAVRDSITRQFAQLDIQPKGTEHRAIETLSGGNQQKVLLARAIGVRRERPNSGRADGGGRHWNQNRNTSPGSGVGRARQRNLLISSEMEEVLALADRVLVIREGRLVRELVGSSATSFDVLKSALGEDERTGDGPA